MFKSFLAVAAVTATLACASQAQAGPAQDALGKCLVLSSSGQDRLDFVVFLYGAISAHPAAKPYSRITDTDREAMSRKAVKLMERLLTDDCRPQALAAVRSEGSEALGQAFGMLGEAAMQELMNDKAVEATFSNFGRYIDEQKWDELLTEGQKK